MQQESKQETHYWFIACSIVILRMNVKARMDIYDVMILYEASQQMKMKNYCTKSILLLELV